MSKTSMVDPRWRLLGRLRLYCDTTCIVTVLTGCLMSVGWATQVMALRWAFAGSWVLEPSTAFGLILLGASLWLLLPDPPRRSHRYTGMAFGALAATIGAATLVEYIFGLKFRVDRVLVTNTGAIALSWPARMAPSIATVLLALGLSLVLLDWKTRRGRRPAQVLSLWGAVVAIMSLSGYLYGAAAVYGVFSFSQVSVRITLVLFLMSAAIFFARPKVGIAGDITGRFLGSAMARGILPAVLVLPIVSGWIRALLQRAGIIGAELGLALNTTMNVVTLSVLLWFNARKLNRTEESLEEVREAGNIHYDAAMRDELTGLYNRRGFLTFAEEQIALACAGHRQLLVVFADVDGLKTINDTYGHAEGDRAIKKAADVLLTVFRDTDIVARLGGDEFAILALDCSPVGLVRISAHFDKLLRMANSSDDPWELSISVGTIHVDSQHQLSIDDLLSLADKLMYEQKRSRPVAV